MPIPYTVFTSVAQFDFSFIVDPLEHDALLKFIEHIIVFQRELDAQGIKDNLYELIFIAEVMDGELFVFRVNGDGDATPTGQGDGWLG